MRLLFGLFLTLILSVSTAFSQSEVLNRGESAFSIMGSHADSEFGSTSQVTGAFSILSFIDIGAFYASLPNASNAAGGYVQLHLLGEYVHKGQVPFSISVFGQLSNVGSNTSKTFGVSFYHRFGKGDKPFAIPAISISNTSFEGRGSDNVAASELSLALGGRASKSLIFYFTPSYTFVEESNSFGVTGGITFAFGKKKESR